MTDQAAIRTVLPSRRTWLAATLSWALADLRAGATAEWASQSQVGIWRILATISGSELSRYQRQLVALQQRITDLLPLPEARDFVTVAMLANERQYRRYVDTYFPRAPRRPALYVRGRGPGMVITHHAADADVNLRHEATHGLLHACLPVVPLWIDEGLAEYFEHEPAGKLTSYPQRGDLRTRLASGRLPTLPQLEALTRVEQMGQAEYTSAWSWVFFLLHGGPQPYGILREFIASLAARQVTPPISSRLARIPIGPADYRAFWRKHSS